jgi:glycosyltransferase involved in cell wall biosynthesis
MSSSLARASTVRVPASVAAPPMVSIVLPARNEAAGIQAAIKAVHELLEDIGMPFEIIVGDSASDDGTALCALALELPCVRVIRADQPGKGLALTRAMMRARGSIIGFLDADLEISPDYLRPAIQAVLVGADAAIGSKAIDPTLAASRTLFRRTTTRIANQLIRLSLGTKLKDHQAGMKVFRREALLPVLRQVRSTGWLWDTELLATMCTNGAWVVEIPVRTSPNRPSRLGSAQQLAGAAFELTQVCTRVFGRRWSASVRTATKTSSLQPAG